jgi:hypothetical protein
VVLWVAPSPPSKTTPTAPYLHLAFNSKPPDPPPTHCGPTSPQPLRHHLTSEPRLPTTPSPRINTSGQRNNACLFLSRTPCAKSRIPTRQMLPFVLPSSGYTPMLTGPCRAALVVVAADNHQTYKSKRPGFSRRGPIPPRLRLPPSRLGEERGTKTKAETHIDLAVAKNNKQNRIWKQTKTLMAPSGPAGKMPWKMVGQKTKAMRSITEGPINRVGTRWCCLKKLWAGVVPWPQ